MPYVVLHLANSYYSGAKGLFNCTSAPVPTSMGADKLPLPLATALHTMSTIIDTISPTDISTMHRSCNRDISCAINSESPPLSQTSLPQFPIIDEQKPWYFLTPKSFAVLHFNIQGLLGQAYRLGTNIRDTHSKIDYLRYSSNCSSAPAIICLTETNVSVKQIVR